MLEHQDGFVRGFADPLAHRHGHIGERAFCDAVVAFEGDGGGGHGMAPGEERAYCATVPISQLHPGKIARDPLVRIVV
jgi:hypothetical protein